MDRKEGKKDFKELYTKTFSQLTASQEKLQEVIDMTENRKPKKTARRLLVAVAVMALAVAVAMGANAASGGELFARIVSHTSYETPEGRVDAMTIKVDDGAPDSGLDDDKERTFSIYQDSEDGKAYLSYTDENGDQVKQEIDLESPLPIEGYTEAD